MGADNRLDLFGIWNPLDLNFNAFISSGLNGDIPHAKNTLPDDW
jgi:hypothetical protein